MAGQVERDDGEVLSELGEDGAPHVAVAAQPVQQQERRAVAANVVRQRHESIIGPGREPAPSALPGAPFQYRVTSRVRPFLAVDGGCAGAVRRIDFEHLFDYGWSGSAQIGQCADRAYAAARTGSSRPQGK